MGHKEIGGISAALGWGSIPARHSGLRIQHCHSCGHRSQPSSNLIPKLGTPYVMGQPKKKKQLFSSMKWWAVVLTIFEDQMKACTLFQGNAEVCTLLHIVSGVYKHWFRSYHHGAAVMSPLSMRTQVWSLALVRGLRIWCSRELWCRSQTCLESGVAVTVA